jgi:hypothetical protein
MTMVVLLGMLATAPFADLARGVEVLPRDPPVPLAGKPVAAARWTDKLGANLLVLTETARVGPASGGTKRLHGYHFVRPAGVTAAAWKPLWRINDGVFACEFDLTLAVRPASLTITDLDQDGTAETAFAYVASCRSDVSPDDLKVLMHEGPTKYALRGTTRLQVGADEKGKPEFAGGTRKPDPAFTRAPREFLAHAQRLFDQAGGK